jgi:4a-hydroxytetrahydrobiopterin dehydratase
VRQEFERFTFAVSRLPIAVHKQQTINHKLITMWQEENNKLYRKFEFKNFSEAFAFMTRVALEAEKMDHHPLWTNVWNQVEVWLSTHSAGDVVTDKDRQLAKKIDALVKSA